MMQRFVSLLVILLMACPAVVAMGAAYSDSFDNAAPDQSWGFQDSSGNQEFWLAGTGLYGPDQPSYSVGFGGAANIGASNIPPTSVFGILSDNTGNPIAYTGGSLTVSGLLNADGSSTTGDHALIGFMADTNGNSLMESYTLFISPTWHYVALYSLEEVGHPTLQQAIRLDIDERYGLGHLPQPGDPLMDIPIFCTMQIETISPGGNIRISASAYGDYDGTGTPTGSQQELAKLSFVVGVDSPDTAGHDPGGSFGPGDVPKLYGGGTGFAGVVTADVPQVLNTSVDDFAAWESLKGDFDLDGDVDVSDLGILATNYGATTDASVFLGDGDFNGTVDVSDLGILATNYGNSVWASAAAVPEPATISMLVLGALALLIRRRK